MRLWGEATKICFQSLFCQSLLEFRFLHLSSLYNPSIISSNGPQPLVAGRCWGNKNKIRLWEINKSFGEQLKSFRIHIQVVQTGRLNSKWMCFVFSKFLPPNSSLKGLTSFNWNLETLVNIVKYLKLFFKSQIRILFWKKIKSKRYFPSEMKMVQNVFKFIS